MTHKPNKIFLMSDTNISISEFEKDSVVDFIDVNKKRMRELSLRMVLKIADLKRMSPTNWQNLALATVCKNSL